jgi:hypothetical protein
MTYQSDLISGLWITRKALTVIPWPISPIPASQRAGASVPSGRLALSCFLLEDGCSDSDVPGGSMAPSVVLLVLAVAMGVALI